MMKKVMFATLGLVLSLSGAMQAQASTNSNQVGVALSAQLASSFTIVAATPVQAFGLVTPGSTTAAAVPVSVVSTWVLNSGQTVKLYAYFSTATTGMTGTLTGDLIPVSAFTGSVNGGTASAFSTSSPFSSTLSLLMYSQTLTALTAIGARTDTLNLSMNLSGLTLAADNYAGTMYIQGQAL